MKVSWDFFAKRKGTDLGKFLYLVESKEEALALFERTGIEVPDIFEEFWSEKIKAKQSISKPVQKKPSTSKRGRPRKSKPSSDNVKKNDKEKKEKNQYFRKVIKK